MSEVQLRKAELVATVLERLADGIYSTDENEDGASIIIPLNGETFIDREQYFSEELRELEQMPKFHMTDQGLAEIWSDDWTRSLLEELTRQSPVRQDMITELSDKLQGKSYEEVINYLYKELTSSLRHAEGLLATGRETIPKAEAMKLSGELDEDLKEDLDERLANFHARRLSKQIPKTLKRHVELGLLTPHFEVPIKVKRYIEEASKSYLNGQFIACLMVCRSAIEFAVRDRLKTCGYGSALEFFEKGTNGDSLCQLIELAKKNLPKYYSPLEEAQMVRKSANYAVHADPPDDGECKTMFLKTRKVMQGLYSEP